VNDLDLILPESGLAEEKEEALNKIFWGLRGALQNLQLEGSVKHILRYRFLRKNNVLPTDQHLIQNFS
jgi:hypothetical protein